MVVLLLWLVCMMVLFGNVLSCLDIDCRIVGKLEYEWLVVFGLLVNSVFLLNMVFVLGFSFGVY